MLAGKPLGQRRIPGAQTFAIGSCVRHGLLAPGSLYAFANDARGAYNDNLGEVKLTIRRAK
jgi:hypothetical protein